MFEGFHDDRIDTGGATLRVRHGGDGPPVLFLHGHPRTHATWYRLVPLLADRHTLVCPDLRGYGQSSKPPTTPDHAPYSKRAMAEDCVALMRGLGHQTFTVVGHDRGGYVATRLALDHPQAVTRLTVLGDIPIGEALARCDARFAAAWWHWFFLGQTDKPAEQFINPDPESWYGATPEQLGDAWEDFRTAIHDPATVRAMCEDYRAGLGIDRAHDDADRQAGHRITCPVQVLWAIEDDLTALHGDVLRIWRDWAHDVTGHAIPGGHHMAEDAPTELAAALTDFWS